MLLPALPTSLELSFICPLALFVFCAETAKAENANKTAKNTVIENFLTLGFMIAPCDSNLDLIFAGEVTLS